MALQMFLKWRNRDASEDINRRVKTIFNKGFVEGATITPTLATYEVDVSPFIAINYDGAIVTSDATVRLPVVNGQNNNIVLRARYRLFDSPILTLESLSDVAYAGDPELNWLVRVGVVDLTGSPAVPIPAANIEFQLRDTVDVQARDFFRDPVANTGALPVALPHSNRDGDVRMTLDTRSFYTWNDGLGIWQQVNEASLNAHRDEEHHNGIVASSSPNTLLPTAVLTNINIANVPPGSAVTVDGLRIAGPAGPTVIFAGASGRTSEGLIQVWMDSVGNISAEYRAFYAAAPNIPNCSIVGISDNHGTGAGLILHYDSATTSLQWNSGEPVNIPGVGRYRLFRPDYSQWIEVEVTGGLGGLDQSDSVTVNATRKVDATFLIANFRWDGAATLSLGEDKRMFGNLAYPEMSDDFKQIEFLPPWDELRGNMVYEGGLCSEIAGPSLNLRVQGPLVAYIEGRRYIVPITFGGQNGYTGLTMPASSTRYLYVDSAGVFQVSATDPTTVPGLVYAEVARIVTGVGDITTIEDRRDPQLIVGNATRNSRVRFTGTASARWEEANKRLVVEDTSAAAPVGVELQTGSLIVTDNRIYAPQSTNLPLFLEDTFTDMPTGDTVAVTNGSAIVIGTGTQFFQYAPPGTRVRFGNGANTKHDSNTYVVLSVQSDTQLTLTSNYTGPTGSGMSMLTPIGLSNFSDRSLAPIQPLRIAGNNDAPSILSAIRDGQRAQQAGVGVDDSAGAGIVLSFAANSVTIGVGTLYDFQGRRVTVTSPISIDTTSLADGTYDVYWDGELNGGTGGFDVGGVLLGAVFSHGGLTWRRSLGLGILSKSGGANVALTECKMLAAGHGGQLGFTIGASGAGSLLRRVANFRTLRTALAFKCMYASNDYLTRTFYILDQIDEGANLIDFNTFEFAGLAANKLDGMTVEAMVSGTTVNTAIIRWGVYNVVTTAPLIDFRHTINSAKFNNLRFEHKGDTGPNNDNCWIKNPAANLTVNNCGFGIHADAGGVGIPGEPLYCLVNYDVSSALGGDADANLTAGTRFENCNFSNICNGTEAIALTTAAMSGRLTFSGCAFGGATYYSARIVNIASATATCDVTFENCRIGAFNSAIIEAPVGVTGKLQVVNSTISAEPGAAVGPAVGTLDVINCLFTANVGLYGSRSLNSCTFGAFAFDFTGAKSLIDCTFDGSTVTLGNIPEVTNCRATGGSITGSAAAAISGCDFSAASFTGGFRSIDESKIALGSTGILTPTQTCSISNSSITKSGAVNTWLNVTTAGVYVYMTAVDFSYTGGAGDGSNHIIIDASSQARLYITNSFLDGSIRSGAAIFGDMDTGHKIHVSNTTILSDQYCVRCDTAPGGDGEILLTNNTMSSISQGQHIYITGSGADRYGQVIVSGNTLIGEGGSNVIIEYANHTTFTNNTIVLGTSASLSSSLSFGANGVSSQRSVIVGGNTLRSSQCITMEIVVAGHEMVRIVDNLIDNGRNGSSGVQRAKIYVSGSENCTVRGNTLRDNSGTAPSYAEILLFGNDNMVVSDNTLEATGTEQTVVHIDVDGGQLPVLQCNNNILFSVGGDSGTSDCAANISIYSTDQDYRAAACQGNTLVCTSANNTGTGDAYVVVSIDQARACQMIGNILRASAAGGSAAKGRCGIGADTANIIPFGSTVPATSTVESGVMLLNTVSTSPEDSQVLNTAGNGYAGTTQGRIGGNSGGSAFVAPQNNAGAAAGYGNIFNTAA